MKRVRAYGSSCSLIILFYLHPFCRDLLFLAKDRKKSLKTLILSIKVINNDTIKSTPLVLVMGSTMTVSICNLFNNYYFLTHACAGFLKSRAFGVNLLKSTCNAKIFIRRLSCCLSNAMHSIGQSIKSPE